MKVCLLIIMFSSVLSAWQSDNCDGTYTNPPLYADFPDPDIIRVGDDFYFATTTFANTPGLTILHSRDLVSWEYISHVIPRLEGRDEYNLKNGGSYRHGIFAPSLKYNKGTFYAVVTPVSQNTFIYRTNDIHGPWQSTELNCSAFDPCLLFDDGKAYIATSGAWDGTVTLHTLNDGLTQSIKQEKIHYNRGCEGTKIVKRGDWYYMFNSIPSRLAMTVSRAKSLFGPWETKNSISDKTGGHQGAIVELPDGSWYGFVMKDYKSIGRMTNISPIFWEDNWPIWGTPDVPNQVPEIAEKPIKGKAVYKLSTSDNFDKSELGLQWQWNHNPDNSRWSLTERSGFLRLKATQSESFWTARNTLVQKGQGPWCRGEVKLNLSGLKPGDTCGFGTLGKYNGYIAVKCSKDNKLSICMDVLEDTRNGITAENRAKGEIIEGTEIYIRLDMDFKTDFGICSYSEDGDEWQQYGGKFKLAYDWRTGTFQGPQFAIFCFSQMTDTGYVDVDWFHYYDQLPSERANGFKPASTNQPGKLFPQVNSERCVLARIIADEAHSVALDIGGVKYPMAKDIDGLWTGVSEPQDEGFHYYQLVIDGAQVPDPGSMYYYGASRWGSGIEIPARDQDFYAMKNVPHGHIRENVYFSKVTNKMRRCFVYTPPSYDTDTSVRYPVLYLQHGGGEDETGWSNQGKVNLIMDNLLADGKARPFIIVMDNGSWSMQGPPHRRQQGAWPPSGWADTFKKTLLEDIIPMIDANYRTIADQKYRAMAGLSMGGMQTNAIAMENLDVFSHIGIFSGGTVGDPSTAHNGVMADEEEFNKKVKLIFESCGSKEYPDRVLSHVNQLKAAGINAVSYVSPDTAHEWQTWRRSFYNFAPLLFGNTERSVSESESLSLWYDKPAEKWVEALPVGNGRLGAMVFGGIKAERLQLNEDTLWAGGPYEPANPKGKEYLPEIRKLIFEGKYREGANLAQNTMMARPMSQMQYQTAGNLLLTFQNIDKAEDYRRELNLNDAIASVTYSADGVKYRRELFSSYVDNVILLRLSASEKGKISFDAKYETPLEAQISSEENDTIVVFGVNRDSNGIKGALKFQVRAKVINYGGNIHSDQNSIYVENADSVIILIAAATSYKNYADVSGDPEVITKNCIAKASEKSYDAIRADHVDDYQELFHRVKLDLGTTDTTSFPTDWRIANSTQADDPQLAALYFQFGRYLLISSSRVGTQPANLQGIWNDSMDPPWGSKYTININTEMNYWPAESTNLSECAFPLFSMIKDISETGARTAEVTYGADGWVTHHNTDLWRATAPIDGVQWGLWPTGGAWLCKHIWDHYEYTFDKTFLKEYYPVMKGSAQFFLDTLVKDTQSGWLVTCPSISPENGHPQGTSVCAGPTMDMQILRDLFTNCISAAKILGIDMEFADKLKSVKKRLAPNQIGSNGQLQEWLYDWDMQVGDLHHRHVSHLYGLYPSDQINIFDTPEYAGAARKSLEIRGDEATGWGIGWRLNLWARLHDSEHAYKILQMLLRPSRTYPNMFDAHPPFQIDGNFGGTSGICEMLLQSRLTGINWEIEPLAALPEAWPCGYVSGLCAKGGFEVDIHWKEGRLTNVKILSNHGNPCQLRYKERVFNLDIKKGQIVVWKP